jgi:hypothetical protein
MAEPPRDRWPSDNLEDEHVEEDGVEENALKSAIIQRCFGAGIDIPADHLSQQN